MKKTLFLLLMMAASVAGHAQSALFSKYDNVSGVTIVQVSKAMFRQMPDIKVGNHNIKKIAQKIDNLQVLSCNRQAIITKINKDATTIYAKNPWEEVMRYKDGNENTTIYMYPTGKGKYEYALITTAQGVLEIINIAGNLSLQEIKEIANDR